MQEEDVKDLEAFLGEFDRETDRGLALVGAAVIDEKLEQILRAFFREDRTIANQLLDAARQRPLGSFAARADMAFAVGLIEEAEYREIKLIAKIRNRFAHGTHGTSFKSTSVAELCAQLKSPLPPLQPEDEPTSRMRYTVAIMIVYLRLYYRPSLVAKEQRFGKVWVSREDVQWVDLLATGAGREPVLQSAMRSEALFLQMSFKQKGAPDSTAVRVALPLPKLR